MNKIDEFVEEYGEGFERLSSDDFTWRDNKKQCRADLRSLIESLLPSDEEIAAIIRDKVELSLSGDYKRAYIDGINRAAEEIRSRILTQ